MDLVLAALPYLAVLAFPLMMLPCVLGMRGTGCGPAPAGTDALATHEARVAAIRRQLAAAQAELAALEAAGPAALAGGHETQGGAGAALSERASAARRPA